MTRLERHVKPITPGEMLHDEFLEPLGLTQQALATHIGCDVKTINRLVKGRTRLTPTLAIKLAAAFGTTPELWLNYQNAVDLYEAKNHNESLPASLIKDAS